MLEKFSRNLEEVYCGSFEFWEYFDKYLQRELKILKIDLLGSIFFLNKFESIEGFVDEKRRLNVILLRSTL